MSTKRNKRSVGRVDHRSPVERARSRVAAVEKTDKMRQEMMDNLVSGTPEEQNEAFKWLHANAGRGTAPSNIELVGLLRKLRQRDEPAGVAG